MSEKAFSIQLCGDLKKEIHPEGKDISQGTASLRRVGRNEFGREIEGFVKDSNGRIRRA